MGKVAALIVALLAFAAPASAYTLAPGSLHDPITTHALKAAERFWHADPPCPTVSVQPYGADAPDGAQPPPGLIAAAAYADPNTCTIWLNGPYWFPLSPTATTSDGHTLREDYCIDIIHEWGHLVLGYNYYAATNPADPAHSPDPRSIMYYDPTALPAGCATACAKAALAPRAGARRKTPTALVFGSETAC